jgi:hypothetical protein
LCPNYNAIGAVLSEKRSHNTGEVANMLHFYIYRFQPKLLRKEAAFGDEVVGVGRILKRMIRGEV